MIRISIVMRNRSKYLKNWLMLGFECMYYIENFIIDYVMNSVIGMNIIEKKFILKLSDSLRVWMVS